MSVFIQLSNCLYLESGVSVGRWKHGLHGFDDVMLVVFSFQPVGMSVHQMT